MLEDKNSRFRRVAEARVNKIIKMVRLLGNCSNKMVYAYNNSQVEQIFDALQEELIQAKRRYAQSGKKKFSLPTSLRADFQIHPSIELPLPDGTMLKATAFADSEYPAINIYWDNKTMEPEEEICFAEYNPNHSPSHELCVGAYQSHQDDTTYYQSYQTERESNA